jgi:hypothetical protein
LLCGRTGIVTVHSGVAVEDDHRHGGGPAPREWLLEPVVALKMAHELVAQLLAVGNRSQ